MMNLSNSTATTSTYSGGTEDHSPSHLHVGVVFGIVIIGIVLIVTLLLLLCKAIKSTYPQMHTNWTADIQQIFRHHTNGGRRKSRSVVNHSDEQKHQVCTSSRPDFQLVVKEQKLCGSHNHNPRNENQGSFALLKSAAQYESSLQEKPPPAYSEVIQNSAYPSHFTNQQTINGTLADTCKPACSDYPSLTPQLDSNIEYTMSLLLQHIWCR